MLTFQALWKNHPTISGTGKPCVTDGKPNFSNQCAIRIGVALSACGVKTTHLPGVRHCWHHEKSAGHTLAAEELAKGLKQHSIAGLGVLATVEPNDFASVLKSKKGIIFFKDYWARSGEDEPNVTGDHIDLWNGSRLTDWKSWITIQWGIGNDYKQSKEVWFWEIK